MKFFSAAIVTIAQECDATKAERSSEARYKNLNSILCNRSEKVFEIDKHVFEERYDIT